MTLSQDDAYTTVLDDPCSECGGEVPRSDAVRENGYDAVFCSHKCRHKWVSELGRRLA